MAKIWSSEYRFNFKGNLFTKEPGKEPAGPANLIHILRHISIHDTKLDSASKDREVYRFLMPDGVSVKIDDTKPMNPDPTTHVVFMNVSRVYQSEPSYLNPIVKHFNGKLMGKNSYDLEEHIEEYLDMLKK